MSKYIDADRLKQAMEREFDMQDLYLPVHFFDVVDEQDAADVAEVRHGRWEWHSEDTCFYCCSNCGHNAYGNTGEILSGYYNFCPNCGSRMDLDEVTE